LEHTGSDLTTPHKKGRPMNFEVGRAYERQSDRATAVVMQTDETGQNAVLQFDGTDETVPVRAEDVPAVGGFTKAAQSASAPET
jgi:hypothetical protein